MSKIKVDPTNPKNMSIRIVKWREIREEAHKANSYVASLIDEIDPGPELPLIEACYPYGVDMHKEGVHYFPTNNGALLTIDEPEFDKKIRGLLDYSSCPLGFIVDKSAEVYVESDEGRSIPFKLFKPGVTFGVWEIMSFPKIQMRKPWNWNISSGARTTFLLPSVNERNSFNKLKRAFNLKSHMPSTIFDQRKIFGEIAQRSDIEWKTKILYFSKEWLNDNTFALAKLKQYWYQEAWEQTQHWLNRMNLDYSWESLIGELDTRNIKIKSYILDTLKHLISLGCGTIAGFSAATKDEVSLPRKLIQDSYVNIYGLKLYYPIIMQPAMLATHKPVDYIYYSMQYPTLCEKPPSFTSFPSVLTILRELKNTIDIFLDLAKKWPKISDSRIDDFLNYVEIDYFHSEKDKLNQINTINLVFRDDSTLKPDDVPYGPRMNPDSAHFFRGCVRIGFHKGGIKSY